MGPIAVYVVYVIAACPLEVPRVISLTQGGGEYGWGGDGQFSWKSKIGESLVPGCGKYKVNFGGRGCKSIRQCVTHRRGEGTYIGFMREKEGGFLGQLLGWGDNGHPLC